MILPPELLARPPRDPASAVGLLKKTQKTAFAMIFGGAALFPLVVGLFYLNFGDLNLTTVSISLGISTLVELMGVALLVNARKSLQLFREGQAAVGTIRKVVSLTEEGVVSLEVEFLGGNGTTRVGKLTMLGVTQLDLRVGAEVAVLHSLSDPRRFAVYTPGLGMVAGIVTG